MKHINLFCYKNTADIILKLIMLLLIVFYARPSGALEIKLDSLIKDVKSSIKHQKKNDTHNYSISKSIDGKQHNLNCDTNASLEELAKTAVSNPSKIKANCKVNQPSK